MGREEQKKEEASLRGRTAREIVRVANHLPVLGSMRLNGELQNLIRDREKEWRYPDAIRHSLIRQPEYVMELLENAGEEREPSEKPVILMFHGGGYYGKLHNAYRAMAVHYHEITGGFDVCSVDYRVAPEHPFPAAHMDSISAYQWLLGRGYLPEHIVVCGDSAGGGLSLALCLYLRDHALPLPAGIVTMSAWTDLTKSGDSYQENFDRDPIFGGTRHTMVYKEGYYLNHDPALPYISPVYGSFEQFPPMLMQAGSLEMLLDDTLSVAARAKAVGVKVRSHIYPGMFHVFQMGLSSFPESREAWEEISHFIRIVIHT